jgi:lysophospholipase L1-like esterase
VRGRRERLGTGARGACARVAVAVLALVLALAGCGSSHAPSPRRSSTAPRPSPAPVWDRGPSSVAAVGDSITRGFDACAPLSDCPAVSWSTGTDTVVDSLAMRLLGAHGMAGRTWNAARSGARMADLPAQMTRVAAHAPALVTVLAGANDACRDSVGLMTPVADFRASFALAMRRLRSASPRSEVYVSSLPDLKRLWSAGRGNPLGRTVWSLGICATMLGHPQDDSAAAQRRRQTVYDRLVAYNAALRDVCAKDTRCRYDGGAVFGYRFTDAQLSHWDWFHPGRDGQSRLASIAYRDVTAQGPAA